MKDVGLVTEEQEKLINRQYDRALFEFMKSVDKNTSSESMINCYSKFGGIGFKLLMFGLDLSIRNLPAKVLKLTYACFEGTLINAELVNSNNLETRYMRH